MGNKSASHPQGKAGGQPGPSVIRERSGSEERDKEEKVRGTPARDGDAEGEREADCEQDPLWGTSPEGSRSGQLPLRITPRETGAGSLEPSAGCKGMEPAPGT